MRNIFFRIIATPCKWYFNTAGHPAHAIKRFTCRIGYSHTISVEAPEGVTFEVPGRPGTYDYVCEPHAMMMRGRIIVQ